jgi:isoquinoline 1-oxidoreductase alpha subunit
MNARGFVMQKLLINGQEHELDVSPDMPLLWVLRDVVGLTGTKYGCGIAQCGVCTVHLDGQAVRSCVLPVSAVAGRKITTIEAVGELPMGQEVQKAWLAHEVVQCGYCQPGQIMSAVALLQAHPDANDEQITTAMAGNLCRCATYTRIRAAIKSVSQA